MAESDRTKWDQRYFEAGATRLDVPCWLADVDGELPREGRALDIAAGDGRLTLWLARRGLDVVAVDISSVGLDFAYCAAEEEGLRIATMAIDLEVEPLPNGPFDIITCFSYRQRDLFPYIRESLNLGGIFVAEIATVPNLELHAHPSFEYLAKPGELRRDCGPLEIVYYEEDWFQEHASARVVARK